MSRSDLIISFQPILHAFLKEIYDKHGDEIGDAVSDLKIKGKITTGKWNSIFETVFSKLKR